MVVILVRFKKKQLFFQVIMAVTQKVFFVYVYNINIKGAIALLSFAI